jgi:hypothetical protein
VSWLSDWITGLDPLGAAIVTMVNAGQLTSIATIASTRNTVLVRWSFIWFPPGFRGFDPPVLFPDVGH